MRELLREAGEAVLLVVVAVALVVAAGAAVGWQPPPTRPADVVVRRREELVILEQTYSGAPRMPCDARAPEGAWVMTKWSNGLMQYSTAEREADGRCFLETIEWRWR